MLKRVLADVMEGRIREGEKAWTESPNVMEASNSIEFGIINDDKSILISLLFATTTYCIRITGEPA